MIPNQFTPECHKIHIIAVPETPDVKCKKRKRNANKKNEVSIMKQKESNFF